jgi:hypothetical protein
LPVCGGFVVLLVAAGIAPAPALGSTSVAFKASSLQQPLPAAGGFRVKAGNGYSLVVLGVSARGGHPASVEIVVSGRHRGVVYSAPATVTETSIQANLGELGEISVAFHPSGRPTTVRPKCGGSPVSFDSGSYEGTIDFHGEEGYTEVDATSAPGNLDFWLDALCLGIGGGSGPLLPGAELHIRNPQLGPEFTVVKNRPDAPARVEVGVSEYRDGISIERFTALLMPTGSFKYDPRLQVATLDPPLPFAGSGRFDRSKKASKRWSGDLTIDMPGREGVPLTGSGLRATLVHAEWDGRIARPTDARSLDPSMEGSSERASVHGSWRSPRSSLTGISSAVASKS